MSQSETTKQGRVVFPDDVPPLDPTENLLVMGPALSGKSRVAFDLLADAYDVDACPCVITATDSAPQFRTRFDPYVDSEYSAENVVVIDSCASASSREASDSRTFTVGSPADLTGLGIQLSKVFGQLPKERREGSRVLIDSLSSLLVYSGIERLFKFVNIVNRRVTEAGGSTIHLLDTDAVEAQHRQQLLQLFSTVIDVRDDAGETEFRLRGAETTDWQGYSVRHRA
jgi:KaiC/GvpD/RAD55 family RecA-like ATPase